MKPLICQMASGHSVEDERILHRMAETAAKYGYESAFAVPHDGRAVSETVQLVPCPKTGKTVSRWQRWTSAAPLLLWALRSKAAVFQIHDPDLLTTGLILKLFGRCVIYDVHDDYEASFKDRFQSRKWIGWWFPSAWWCFEINAARCMDGVIVADRHLAVKFSRCSPIVLGNYPRVDFTGPAHAEEEETFNLIYVGGVTQERGLGMALEALQLLSDPRIRLHIIGAGRDEALMEKLRAEPRVILHGRVPWRELHMHYVRAHIGLALYQPLASFMYCPGENAVKVLEYMAAGIPVLCSDFPGLKAFVEDSGCGMVVSPDDPTAIAEKVQRLVENADLRKQLGAKGRELFETEYNWEKHEHRLVALYERILNQ